MFMPQKSATSLIDVASQPAVAATRPTPFTVQVSNSLVDEAQGWNDVLIQTHNMSSAPPVCQYRLGDSWQAAVFVDNRYQILSRSQEGHGWQLTAGPAQAAGCLGITVAQTPDGAAWTFALKKDSVAVFKDIGFGPVYKTEIRGAFTQINVAYTPAVPQHTPVMYMADSHHNLVLFRWVSQDRWDMATADVRGMLGGATFAVVALSPVRFAVAAPSSKGLRTATITWSGKKAVADEPHTDTSVRADVVYGGYQLDWDEARFIFGRITQGSYAVFIQQRSGAVQLDGLWDTSAQSCDDAGMMHLYLRRDEEPDWPMCVLHQTGWSPEGPIWSGSGGKPVPIPILPMCSRAYPARHPSGSADVIILSYPRWTPENLMTMTVMTQDAVTSRWTSELVRTDAPTYQQFRRWQSRCVVSDGNGVPIAGHGVRIRSMSNATVTLQGEVRRVGPWADQAVDTTTDANGVLRVSLDAATLSPPSLLLEVDGLPEEVDLHLARDVWAYMAGTGTLPDVGPLDGTTLSTAQVDGSPLVASWPSGLNPEQAAGLIKNVMALGDPNQPPPPKAGYLLQIAEPGRPAYQEFDHIEDLRAEQARHHAAADFGGFFDDVEDFFEDLAEGIATGAAAVGRVAVYVGTKAVEISLMIGDKLVSLGEYVIHTLHDAVDAVSALWNELGVYAARVLDWLKALVNTKDVWDTRTAVERALLELPGYLRAQLQDAAQYADGFFGRQKAAAHAGIAAFAAQYTGQSLVDQPQFAGALDAFSGRASAGAGDTQVADAVVSPSANWLFDRVSGTLAGDASSVATPLAALHSSDAATSAWDAFVAKFEQSGAEFQAALESAGGLLTALVSGGSLDDIARLEISALAEVADHLVDAVLDLCDALFPAAQVLLGAVLDSADELLGLRLDIPGLQPLLDFLARQAGVPEEPLTIAGLAALIVAFPATLLWKVMEGPDARLCPGGRFPSADQPPRLSEVALPQEYLKNREVATIAAVYGIVAGGLQCGLDFVRTLPVHGAVSAVSSGLSLAIKFGLSTLNWPTPTGRPYSPVNMEELGERLTFATWLVGFAAPMLELGAALAAAKSRKPEESPIVASAVSLAGIGSLAVALAAAVEGSEPWPWKVSDVLEPTVDALAPLLLVPIESPWYDLALGAKWAGDLIGLTLPAILRAAYVNNHTVD